MIGPETFAESKSRKEIYQHRRTNSLMNYVLADRDGTLIVEKHYLRDPGEVELIPGVAEAIRLLNELGWEVICVSNQSGVGRGLFESADVDRVNLRVSELLHEGGARVLEFYFCPDPPGVESTHRKPAPGMALDAAQKHGFDPRAVIVVGDKPCDIDLGRNLGAVSVLVRTGHGAKHEELGDADPDFVIDSFADLPAIIGSLGETDARLGTSS